MEKSGFFWLTSSMDKLDILTHVHLKNVD